MSETCLWKVLVLNLCFPPPTREEVSVSVFNILGRIHRGKLRDWSGLDPGIPPHLSDILIGVLYKHVYFLFDTGPLSGQAGLSETLYLLKVRTLK